MEVKLADIIDIEDLQSLMNSFFELTEIGVSIVNNEGNVIVATGWQDICTKFHRVHPKTARYCAESDIELTRNIKPGEFSIYKCKNNLWDMASPILIGEKRIATIFLGQFFYDDEEIDKEVFIQQAQEYGFDTQEYLKALERVPRWSRKKVNDAMVFYTKFAQLISQIGYQNYMNLKLIDDLEKKDEILREEYEKSQFFKELLAHDIGNIMNNIKSSIELIKMKSSPKSILVREKKLVNLIVKQIERCNSLISNVRKISQLEDLNQSSKKINLKELLDSIIERIENSYSTLDLEIKTVNLTEKNNVKAGSLLLEAFENIVLNAIVHNQSNKIQIEINVSRLTENDEKWIKIEFKDNGVGIPNERKESIFERGYSTRASGIGLFLVKNIIENSQGKVWVENRNASDYSKGSNFVVLLKEY